MNTKREREMKNVASDIEILGQENDTLTCPDCGNNAFHLNGIFTNNAFKHLKVLTVVNCESCGTKYGNMQSFGKGSYILEPVRIRFISNDWTKIL